jgi:hypothetical protein
MNRAGGDHLKWFVGYAKGLVVFLRCTMSLTGPERRLLPAPTWSQLGAKQTPLEVARMTRLTHFDISSE